MYKGNVDSVIYQKRNAVDQHAMKEICKSSDHAMKLVPLNIQMK